MPVEGKASVLFGREIRCRGADSVDVWPGVMRELRVGGGAPVELSKMMEGLPEVEPIK